MSDTIHTQLLMDLQIGSLLGDREAQAQLERLMTQGAAAGLSGGFKKAQGNLETGFIKTFTKAANAGLMPAAKKLEVAFERGSRTIKAAGEQIGTLTTQLAQAEARSDRAAAARLQREIAVREQIIRKEQTALEKQIRKTEKSAQRRADILKEAQEAAGKDWVQRLEEGGEKFGDKVNSAINFNDFDFQNMGKSGSKSAKKMGGRLESWGANVSKSANAGGMAKGFGKAAMMIGKLAGPIGALIGVVGSLGAAVFAGYNNAKEMNKSFLEGASAMDMMGSSAASLGGDLDAMRGVANGLAMSFRMTGQEAVEAMTAFNKAGMTFERMQGFLGESMSIGDTYATITRNAIVASKSIGVEISAIAEYTEKLNRDMGMGLESVQESYGLIFSQARKAGMSTRDFFTAVSEAASGMALYNFRLDDTVNLLTTMQGILGKEAAMDMMGQKGQYRDMSTLDRYKTTMLTGLGTTQSIQRADLERQAATLGEIIGRDLGGANGPAQALLTRSGSVDTKQLANMSAEQYRAVRGSLSQSGEAGQTIARQLDNIRDLAVGATGNQMDAATGLGSLSRTGELAQNLSTMAQAFPEGISSIEGMNRAMFENITGIQGEQFDTLRRLDRALRADYERMASTEEGRARLTGADGEMMNFAESVAAGVFEDSSDVRNEALAAQPVMQRIASETMVQTRSIAQTLKNKIAGTLESIWSGVQGLLQFGATGNDEHIIADALSEMSTDLQEVADKRAEFERDLTAVREGMANAEGSTEIADFQRQERALQAQIDRALGHEDVIRRQMNRTAAGLNTGSPTEELARSLEAYMLSVDTGGVVEGEAFQRAPAYAAQNVRSMTEGETTIGGILSSPAATMGAVDFLGHPSATTAYQRSLFGDWDTTEGRRVMGYRGDRTETDEQGNLVYAQQTMMEFIQTRINDAIRAGESTIVIGSQAAGNQTEYDLAGISTQVSLGTTNTTQGPPSGSYATADALAARILTEMAGFYQAREQEAAEESHRLKGLENAEKDTMEKLKSAIEDQTIQLLRGQEVQQLAQALGISQRSVSQSLRNEGGAGYTTLNTAFQALLQDDPEAAGRARRLINSITSRDMSMVGGNIRFDPMDTVVMASKRGGSMRGGGLGGGSSFTFNITGVNEQEMVGLIRRTLAAGGVVDR